MWTCVSTQVPLRSVMYGHVRMTCEKTRTTYFPFVSHQLPDHQAYRSYHTNTHAYPARYPHLFSCVHGASVPYEMFEPMNDVKDEREAENPFYRQPSTIRQSSEPFDKTCAIKVPSHEWCSQICCSKYVYGRRYYDGRIAHNATGYPVDLRLVNGQMGRDWSRETLGCKQFLMLCWT